MATPFAGPRGRPATSASGAGSPRFREYVDHTTLDDLDEPWEREIKRANAAADYQHRCGLAVGRVVKTRLVDRKLQVVAERRSFTVIGEPSPRLTSYVATFGQGWRHDKLRAVLSNLAHDLPGEPLESQLDWLTYNEQALITAIVNVNWCPDGRSLADSITTWMMSNPDPGVVA